MTNKFSATAWLADLKAFLSSVAAASAAQGESQVEMTSPVSAEQIAGLESRLGVSIPAELKSFFVSGAGLLDFSYSLQDDGGEGEEFSGSMRLDFSALEALIQDRDSWIADTWIGEDEEARADWSRTLPFCHLSNGDFLGCVIEGEDAGAVMYLSHDDLSHIVSPSFNQFLNAWALCCYLGPEVWILDPFLENGILNGNSNEAVDLRAQIAAMIGADKDS